MCDNPEWINGLSNPISESYHPNRDGQASGYTPTVSPVLTGAAVRVTAATLRAAARQVATSSPRSSASTPPPTSSIRPAEFRAPT